MDIAKFIENVNGVDWQKYDDAEYFKYRYDGINSFAQTAPMPLIALAAADNESDELLYKPLVENFDKFHFSANGYISHNVLCAIGNDHSGNYYPVAREALPFIIEVALYGNHLVARNCAINILIDLYYFSPGNFHEDEETANELEQCVSKTIRDMIAEHRGNFLKFAIDDTRNKSLIEGLLCIVDEQDE